MGRSTDLILAFDLGGTKLRAAFVDAQGRIKAHATTRVRQDEGFRGLIQLFKETADQLPKSKYKAVSVASAGPLHPEKGILLDPTNFFTGDQSWGVLPLVRELKKVFRKPVRLENDAAAAVLGERWKGGHGRTKNIVAMTLGTGVGVGAICNDRLVRAGQGLHPEAGHIPLDINAKDYPCGCGANGCIEAFLAGSHFAHRLGRLKNRALSGQEAVALARGGDVWVQEAFREYGRQLAQAVRVLCVLFAPEVVVISGGFSHASSLFMDETQALLPKLMERYREGIDLLPKIKVSKLQDEAGILGAAYLALQTKK
ncbi:MAG: ROK family protein [Bdellovibrionales bacterium]|nr:ROK family protein [Bdellovibrionales bacterium]